MSAREISVHNRQRKLRFDLPWLRQFALKALAECALHAAIPDAPLSQLESIEVSVVSDAVIADVHVRFMQIQGPTDVITFEHGEIIISSETAQMYASKYGHTLETELGLYIIHGLLHLNGYDDLEKDDAAKMHKLQERILRKIILLHGHGQAVSM